MSESPSLMPGDDKVFNEHAVDTSPPYGPQLPSYLRRSVAMACGPPGSLPLHMKASQTAPSMSTPSKSDQSSSLREMLIRNESVKLTANLERSSESVQVEERKTDQEQVTPSQKAADMLSKAILQHQAISVNDFAFLIDQIDACINLDEQSIIQMLDLLIEKNGVAAEYGERGRRFLRKEARKKGGQLSFGAFRTIIAYFRSLSKKQTNHKCV
ncbi:hypothetical protein D918_09742 [Trichuris suis]|nr:hypothetical protein D918_09742 [Trichuris suis]